MIVLPPLPAGRVLPVVVAPATVLSGGCAEADPCANDVVQLAADLLETQRRSPGCVGLAAPQVGVPLRVFSLDVSSHPKARTHHGSFVLVNPLIESASRNEKGREGCMSVPDLTCDVKRASRITVRGFLPVTGEQITIETDAFEARAVQHEIDHLDGALILDRVAGAHAIYQRKVYL